MFTNDEPNVTQNATSIISTEPSQLKADNVSTPATPPLALVPKLPPTPSTKPNSVITAPPVSMTANAIATSISKKLQPIPEDSSSKEPVPEIDLISILKISERIELNLGIPFTIDVQPDTRYTLQYLTQCVSLQYPDLNVKSYNYVSTFSLIGYDILCIHAALLYCDLNKRNKRPFHSRIYTTDMNRKEFYDSLLRLNISSRTRPLIDNLTSTYDEQLVQLQYSPGYAGFKFLTDFGRTIPALLMLYAHQVLASFPTNAQPNSVLVELFQQTLTVIDGSAYTISNLLGGPYLFQNPTEIHENWLLSTFERIFNPVINRSLATRPSLAKPHFSPIIFDSYNSVNPYDYTLGYCLENKTTLMKMLKNISDFIKTESPNCLPLKDIVKNSTSSLVQTHFLTVPSLPTWHHLPLGKELDQAQYQTDTEFARTIGFMPSTRVVHNSFLAYNHFPCVPATLQTTSGAEFIPDEEVFPLHGFNPKVNVTPNVAWFQPYNPIPEYIKLCCTIGFNIESYDIVGFTLPMPNMYNSLTENNSNYRIGLIPFDYIHYIEGQIGGRTEICEITPYDEFNQPIGFAFRDMSRVVIPIFALHNSSVSSTQTYGLHATPNCNDDLSTWTYTAWTKNTQPPIEKKSIYLWSSYRVVDKATSPEFKVSFYGSLRPLYGLSVPHYRTGHPSIITPQ